MAELSASMMATRNAMIVVAQSAVAQSVTGVTTEAVLATITIPAGLIGPTGQVDTETLWSFSNSANAKNMRIRLSGTQVLNVSATTNAAVQAHSRVANRGANAQVFYNAGLTGYGTSSSANGTSTIDTTVDVTLTITGQLANVADTLTLESFRVLITKGA